MLNIFQYEIVSDGFIRAKISSWELFQKRYFVSTTNWLITRLLIVAEGFVTVNSSAGIEALESGCPVIAVSPTVYSIDGLSFQGSLDDFWNSPPRLSTSLLVGIKKCLVPAFRCAAHYTMKTVERMPLKRLQDDLPA